ncbi:MAG: hypothetical protein US42_C0004G0001, partial [Candidatus Magasanikbacteria bacterium GW2011_GWC2_37_14]
MYNLLVSWDENAWEGDSFNFGEERFLEYTDEQIRDRYKNIFDYIDEIKTFPCIFAYEEKCKKDPKLGYIVNVERRKGRELRIEYKIINIKKFLSYQNLNELHFDFDIDIAKFELTRTHWAIKNVDLSKELKKNKIKVPHIKKVKVKNFKDYNNKPIFEGVYSNKFFTFNWQNFLSRFSLFKRAIIIIIFLFVISGIFLLWRNHNNTSFNFSELGKQFNSEKNENGFVVDYWVEGNLRNTFDTKKSLERVDYIFWKNKNIGSTYTNGYLIGEIKDLGVEDKPTIKLPIMFEPNESKHLSISFKIPIENEEMLKQTFPQKCTGVFCYFDSNLELNFKDVRGNVFDEKGNLISEELVDAVWVYPNNKSFLEKLIAKSD